MPRSILIVDDNAMNRTALQAILHKEYVTEEAESGAEALYMLRQRYQAFSAVLLDPVMPDMDGYDVLRAMRQNPLLSQIPVIITAPGGAPDHELTALQAGAADYICEPYQAEVLLARLKNLIRLRESAAVLHAIQRDKLTGLLNREAFMETAGDMIAAKPEGFYIMASYDVDGFKLLNEQYGSGAGDDLLRAIAKILQRGFSPAGGICCRIAGDDFAVLYPAAFADSEEIENIHRLSVTPDESLPQISYSVGRYTVADKSIPVSTMLDRAIVARNTVKGRFDRHIAIYDDSLRDTLVHNEEIAREMAGALSNGQFEVWFQPQYNNFTGALIGAEALCRWRHPEKGIIPPDVFIPVFEQNGFIYELDKYMWEQTCVFLRRLLDKAGQALPVSVNISRCDVLRDGLVDVLTGMMKKYDLPYSLLRLEITESAFAKDTEHITQVVSHFVDLGFTVEIDDFGSGYSSLNTLKDVPVQIIKLDMRFLEGGDNLERGGNIIASVVSMARWLGMSVIAEGVETEAQATYLKTIGCEYSQGYFFGWPMPRVEYISLLQTVTHEQQVSLLKTVEHLDNNAFWNPKSMDSLIFNSYVGAACIVEYYRTRIRMMRVTDSYATVMAEYGLDRDLAMKLQWSKYLSEEDKRRFDAAVKRSIETKTSITEELVFSDIPGFKERLYLRVSLRVIASTGERCMVYCLCSDMTARRLAERKAADDARVLQAVMDNMGSGVSATAVKDGKAVFLLKNDRFYDMLGYTREQFERECPDGLRHCIYPADYEAAFQALQQCRKGGDQSGQFRAVKRDGTIIWIHASGSLCQFEGVDAPVTLGVYTDITAEKEAEFRQRTTSTRMDAILHHASNGIAATTWDKEQTKFIFVNDAFFSQLGYTRPQYEAEVGLPYDLVCSEDRENVRRQMAELITSGGSRTLEYRVRRRDGTLMWMRNVLSIVTFEGVNRPVCLSIFTDVTDEKEALEQMRLLNDSAHEILAQPDCEKAVNAALENLLTYFSADRAYIVELDEKAGVSNNTYEVCADAVMPEMEYLKNLPYDRTDFWYETLHRGEFFIVSDTASLQQSQPKTYKLLTAQKIHSIVLAPLWRSGRLFGFIGMDNIRRALHQVPGLTALADYFAILLTHRDLNRRELREERQLFSVQHNLPVALSTVMSVSEDFSFIKDRELRYVCCSRSALRLLGFSNESDIVGKSDDDCLPASVAATYRADSQEVLRTGQARLNRLSKLPAADGTTVILSASIYPIKDDDDHVVGLYGVSRDVTREREQELELSTLLRVIPSGVLKYAADDELGEFAYVNRNLMRGLGYTPSAFRRKFHNHFMEMVYEEDRKQVAEEILRQEANGEIGIFEYRIEAADGTLHWFHDEGIKVTDAAGRAWYYVTLVDVTKRVTAQEQLRMSQDISRLAIEHSGSMVALFNVAEKTLTFSTTVSPVYGVSGVLTDMPRGQVEQGRISQETAAVYCKMFDDVCAGSACGSCTYRQRTITGWNWMEAQYTTVFTDDGTPANAVFSFTDVSEQINQQLAYRKWMQSLEMRPPESYSFFHCTLTETSTFDIRKGTLLPIVFKEGRFFFDERTKEYVNRCVYPDDRETFTTFLKMATLLREYAAGNPTKSLEYRESAAGGVFRWLRLTVDMVAYPELQSIEIYLMFENIDAEKKATMQILDRAEKDPLTGVLNRAAFIARMEGVINRAKEGTQHALIMLDVDDFKHVNDSLGHGAGDQVLQDITAEIGTMLRKTDLLGRLGGDEFFVFLNDIASRENALNKAKRICGLRIKVPGSDVPVTVSLGITLIPQEGTDFDTLYKKVDRALYLQKKNGKNGYRFSNDSMKS